MTNKATRFALVSFLLLGGGLLLTRVVMEGHVRVNQSAAARSHAEVEAAWVALDRLDLLKAQARVPVLLATINAQNELLSRLHYQAQEHTLEHARQAREQADVVEQASDTVSLRRVLAQCAGVIP